MNYARIALAAVAATVFDAVYGFGVYGTLLAPEFARYPERLPDERGRHGLPAADVRRAVHRHRRGRGHLREGVMKGAAVSPRACVSGLLLGVFVALAFAAVNYATLNIGRRLAAMVACAGFVEWLAIGTIIGLVYQPAAGSRRAFRRDAPSGPGAV